MPFLWDTEEQGQVFSELPRFFHGQTFDPVKHLPGATERARVEGKPIGHIRDQIDRNPQSAGS